MALSLVLTILIGPLIYWGFKKSEYRNLVVLYLVTFVLRLIEDYFLQSSLPNTESIAGSIIVAGFPLTCFYLLIFISHRFVDLSIEGSDKDKRFFAYWN